MNERMNGLVWLRLPIYFNAQSAGVWLYWVLESVLNKIAFIQKIF